MSALGQVDLDQIKEVPRRAWRELASMYERNWQGLSGFLTLKALMRWTDLKPHINARIYCLEDDWGDGSYVAVIDDCVIFINTLSQNLRRLSLLLKSVGLQDVHFINTFDTRLMPVVREFYRSDRIKSEEVKMVSMVWLVLSKDQAESVQLKLPPGLTVDSLNEDHVDCIYENEDDKEIAPKKYIARLIEFQESVGIFNGNKELLAWGLESPIGAITMVNTLETHVHLGYNMLVLKAMIQKQSAKGGKIYTCVQASDIGWIDQLKRVGFKQFDKLFLGAASLCPILSSDDEEEIEFPQHAKYSIFD